jgi:hypothetical protein
LYNYLTLTRIAGGFLFRSAHISVGKYSLDLNRLKPIKKQAVPSRKLYHPPQYSQRSPRFRTMYPALIGELSWIFFSRKDFTALSPPDIQNPLLLLHDDSGKRRDFSVLLMKFQKIPDVDIADPVSIGHKKGLVSHIFPDSTDSSPSHGVQSRIHHRDLPGLTVGLQHPHLIPSVCKIKLYIRTVQIVIREPFF